MDAAAGKAEAVDPVAAATDVLIVGGGPAGLATAIRARMAGLSVRVVDRGQPPVDKACGEGLMPDAVLHLRQLGVELPPDRSRRLAGIRYVDGGIVAEGALPEPGGLGVRRLDLHRALAARAAAVGVDLRWGCAVSGLALATPEAGAAGAGRRAGNGGAGCRGPAGAGDVWVCGALTGADGDHLMPARWVVGADGLHSRVRGWAGLAAAPAARRPRFGVRRHFVCAPWSDMVEVHWGEGCEAYVTPVGPDLVGVALLWGDGKASFDSLLARFPSLAARLAGAAPASRDRGAGPLRQRVAAACRGNVALIGDAAGYFDAITGEGLAVALHQSAALIDAIARADARGTNHMSRYAAAHRRIVRLPNAVTALMLALERRPRLRRRAMRALAAEPALFNRLLGIHARALPPRRLGIDGALRLVYRLVTA